MTLSRPIMNSCVILRCCWVFLAAFLCWSWCRVCQNFPKANKPPFVTLFLFSSFVKQIFSQCIVKLEKGFLHSTSIVYKIFVSTSMNTCVWHGGKSLPHALNMLPFLGGELYMLHTHDLITKEVMGLITKQVWVGYVESLKQYCSEATTNLISELERRFLAQELLNAIRVI